MDESKICQQKYDEIVRKEGKMTRDELRDKTARIIESWGTDSFDIVKDPRTYADQILDLPEIKRGLELVKMLEALIIR